MAVQGSDERFECFNFQVATYKTRASVELTCSTLFTSCVRLCWFQYLALTATPNPHCREEGWYNGQKLKKTGIIKACLIQDYFAMIKN